MHAHFLASLPPYMLRVCNCWLSGVLGLCCGRALSHLPHAPPLGFETDCVGYRIVGFFWRPMFLASQASWWCVTSKPGQCVCM